MHRNKTLGLIAALILTFLGMAASGAGAAGMEKPFPLFGTGPVEIRLYTDYFCPPCRSLEPVVEPLLRDMVQKKRAQLIMVDVPLHQHSILYVRHFLYALQARHDLEQAFRARHALNEAALNKENITAERLAEVLKGKGIAQERFDPGPVFARFDALLKEDGINATPTCVIIRGADKKKATGSDEILKALRQLP